MCYNTYIAVAQQPANEENTMTEAVHTLATPTTRGKNVTLWVMQIAAAGMFLFAGGLKLAGAAPMVALFDAIGVGQWFRYVTGAIEVGSAILLLVPGLAAFGAALLICTMIGAVLPLVLLVAAAVILWGRREQIASRLGR